jgi:hypothetical protein
MDGREIEKKDQIMTRQYYCMRLPQRWIICRDLIEDYSSSERILFRTFSGLLGASSGR